MDELLKLFATASAVTIALCVAADFVRGIAAARLGADLDFNGVC